MPNVPEFDLTGLIDMHIHTAPDVRPRYCDDIQAAKEARDAGMRAILIKSHVTLTADRAQIAESVVGDVRVFGGLVLNKPVGGLNPAAVEAALKMGAKEIWMPTMDAANVLPTHEKVDGITIFTQNDQIRNEVYDILDLTCQWNAILATGHLSVQEILALSKLAREFRLKKLLITHPDSPLIRMPVETQIDISGDGIFFERCFVDCTHAMNYATTVEEIANVLRKVGINNTVLTTDFGLASLPSPVKGMREFLSKLSAKGIRRSQVLKMAEETPTFLLDL